MYIKHYDDVVHIYYVHILMSLGRASCGEVVANAVVGSSTDARGHSQVNEVPAILAHAVGVVERDSKRM